MNYSSVVEAQSDMPRSSIKDTLSLNTLKRNHHHPHKIHSVVDIQLETTTPYQKRYTKGTQYTGSSSSSTQDPLTIFSEQAQKQQHLKNPKVNSIH